MIPEFITQYWWVAGGVLILLASVWIGLGTRPKRLFARADSARKRGENGPAEALYRRLIAKLSRQGANDSDRLLPQARIALGDICAQGGRRQEAFSLYKAGLASTAELSP